MRADALYTLELIGVDAHGDAITASRTLRVTQAPAPG